MRRLPSQDVPPPKVTPTCSPEMWRCREEGAFRGRSWPAATTRAPASPADWSAARTDGSRIAWTTSGRRTRSVATSPTTIATEWPRTAASCVSSPRKSATGGTTTATVRSTRDASATAGTATAATPWASAPPGSSAVKTASGACATVTCPMPRSVTAGTTTATAPWMRTAIASPARSVPVARTWASAPPELRSATTTVTGTTVPVLPLTPRTAMVSTTTATRSSTRTATASLGT